jgi:hypothetical protein
MSIHRNVRLTVIVLSGKAAEPRPIEAWKRRNLQQDQQVPEFS